MAQDPQIPMPLASGATDNPNAPQHAGQQAWYKVQGADKKWYTTQADGPGAAKAKIMAMSTPKGVQPDNVNRGPAYDDPTKGSQWGSMVPEFAQGALQIGQKYLVDPFEKVTGAGAQFGKEIGQDLAAEAIDPYVLDKPKNQKSIEQLGKEHPYIMGAAAGTGEVVGGMIADPRNWPFFGAGLARPALQRLIARGFGVQMAKGTYDAAVQLYQNWDKMTPEQRAELGTKGGLSAIMTTLVGREALKGAPTPGPKETPVTGIGKTEAEVKTETTPSPSTGLATKPQMTAEDIKARIAVLEKRIAAQKSTETLPKVEEVKPVAKAAPVKPTEKPLPPAPEARPVEATPSGPEVEIAKLRAQRAEELANLKLGLNADGSLTVKPRQIPETSQAAPPEGTKLEQKQAAMKSKNDALTAKQQADEQFVQEHRKAQAQEAARLRQENEALRAKSPSSPEVGGLPAAPEAAKSQGQPVQATPSPSKPGESVPSAKGPSLDATSEPRSLRGDLGERPPSRGLGDMSAQERLAIHKQRVEAYLDRNPGVSKTHAQQIVAEQMRKEMGALGGGNPEERGQRREDKIKSWLDILRDPKASPESLDQAYKMLTKVYDFSHDDIIQRMAGGADFAKTPVDPRTGIPEASQEGLKERTEGIIDSISKDVDRVMRDYPGAQTGGDVDKEVLRRTAKTTEEYIRDHAALVEGRAVGDPTISGVKDPSREELEKLSKFKDPREDERGSLSFRRLSPAEREAANPLKRLADALDRVADFFEHPRLTPEEAARQQTAANIIREETAKRARTNLEVEKALEEAIKRHNSPSNERENFRKFMDAGEGKPGATFLAPEDQALAQVLHDMFDERWEKVKEVKGLEGDGIENYLAHIWEKSNKAGNVLRGILTGRRPLEGTGRFLKNRFYQYASEGIEHGLEPVTWNPIRLQLAALFDTDRFLMAHEIKDRFKDAGLVQWQKLSDYKNVPPGWERLNDKIFQPRVVGEGALKEYGTYYAPHEVAKIFNNYLSPGLGGEPIFRTWRNYGNRLNMINLGISGYHGTMISLVSATSDLALGLQKIFNYGDFGGGIKDVLRGTVGTFMLRSAAMDYRLGRSIQAEAIEPTGNPSLQKFVDALETGGGRFKQDPWYTRGMANRSGFMNWLKLAPQGKFLQMADVGVRALASPIMEKFVPRVKLGVAARMMEAKLADLQRHGITDQNTVATELGKIWDSVDNRAGQMVYDNLFWNNAKKDLAFTAVRAVGWDLGSIREYGGGALIDAPRQAAKAFRGQRPELTSRLAFTIATPITIGLFGGMVHYLMTGKAPQKTEDYFYPGPEGAKVSFPSYMKDYFAFKEHPGTTIVNKLHPTWSQVIDLYSNSDFYGTEIFHPGDPKLKQGYDILKWYGQSFEPLSFRGISKRIERGEAISSAATGMFGFMPAPYSVGQTKAEQLAFELSSREWKKGPRTSADAERFALVQKFQQQVGSGQKIDINELTQAWKDKRIQDIDIAKIYSNFKVPRLQREFKELNLPDALAVMREAGQDERVQLKPLLLQKYGMLEHYPLDQQQVYDREIRAYLK